MSESEEMGEPMIKKEEETPTIKREEKEAPTSENEGKAAAAFSFSPAIKLPWPTIKNETESAS
jgi:hypothetical protein